MGKKTYCLVLVLALCCAVQGFAAEPPSESGGCVLTPARLGALVEAPSLCAPKPEVSPVAAAQAEIFGNPETEEGCCPIWFRQECYASCAPGCGHWYCDLVCICECLC